MSVLCHDRFRTKGMQNLEGDFAVSHLDELEKGSRAVSSAPLSSPLDPFTTIETRPAIKSFKAEAISLEILQRLVELTVTAPSSYNLQDWRIVLVQSAVQKQALGEAAFDQLQVLPGQ